MDAFAQSTPAPILGSNAELQWGPTSLFGEEFIAMVTSSTPSLSINDQPSSANPFTASLNPLQFILWEISLWMDQKKEKKKQENSGQKTNKKIIGQLQQMIHK